MTVKQLKQLLAKADDDLQVLIPMGEDFDGLFKSPCVEDSGITELGVEEDSDETVTHFVLVPCGFYEEREENHCELN